MSPLWEARRPPAGHTPRAEIIPGVLTLSLVLCPACVFTSMKVTEPWWGGWGPVFSLLRGSVKVWEEEIASNLEYLIEKGQRKPMATDIYFHGFLLSVFFSTFLFFPSSPWVPHPPPRHRVPWIFLEIHVYLLSLNETVCLWAICDKKPLFKYTFLRHTKLYIQSICKSWNRI